ncbi:MAG: A/G-specific adenine glycosylase [Actinomycetes bacterium]
MSAIAAPTSATDELPAILWTWFADHSRDLPWRHADRTPWGVLTSEIMLQQTPVARVEPVWLKWMDRWPTPADLAAATPADVIRAWGTLGYPRRALRLAQAATQIHDRFDGQVPSTYDELTTLAGVGDYTAAAVLAFAFNRRSVVLDTNIRRVVSRIVSGQDSPCATSPTKLERSLADSLVPEQDAAAACWSMAVMELGALVCRAGQPDCPACPVSDFCQWRTLGYPLDRVHRPARQTFKGTDRQARGQLMALLRESPEPVTLDQLAQRWEPEQQRMRALDTLISDGLVEPLPESLFRLPTGPEPTDTHPIAHLSTPDHGRSV